MEAIFKNKVPKGESQLTVEIQIKDRKSSNVHKIPEIHFVSHDL